MQDCLFCNVVSGKMPCRKVYEDEHAVAFLDINPRSPGHTLVVSKSHHGSILDMTDKESGALFESVRRVAASVKEGTRCQGLSIAQSNGEAAGQVVKHAHFHVIPRFLDEVPVGGLEGMLSPRRIDKDAMDSIARSIRAAAGRKPGKTTGEKKAKEKGEEEAEEISFDFGNRSEELQEEY